MNPTQLQQRLSTLAKEVAAPRAAMQKVVLIVEGRAKRNAPVATGTLRRSITSSVVSPTRGQVGSNLEYAAPVEFGTKHMSAQPYLRPAIDDSRSEIEAALKGWANDALRKVGR